MKPSSRSALPLMALTVFIDIAGFGIILPLLPFWTQHLGANPTQIGLILTVYAIAQFLFTPLTGALSDRIGRKPIVVGSLMIEAVSFAMTALSGSLPLLLAARFIGGIGAANLGTAQAVVADVTPPEGRARGMGLIGAAIGMGFVVGPAIGGILSGGSNTAVLPFWVAMVIALVNAALVLALLPETRMHRAAGVTQQQRKSAGGNFFSTWGVTLQQPVMARLIVINLLFTLAFTAMEAVYPLFTQHTFGWDARQNGYIFAFVGIVIVIVQGGLVGQLVKRFGERALLISGLMALAAGLLFLPWSTTLGLMLITLAALSAGEGLITPTTSALLSLAATSQVQGETLGVAQGAAALGRIFGPLAAGALFTVGVAAPFVVGGVLVLLALLLALGNMPTRRQIEDPSLMSIDSGSVAPDEAQVSQ